MLTEKRVKIEPLIETGMFSSFITSTSKARVIEVGNGCSVEVGDIVMIPNTTLTSFNSEDGVYKIIFEDEINLKL